MVKSWDSPQGGTNELLMKTQNTPDEKKALVDKKKKEKVEAKQAQKLMQLDKVATCEQRAMDQAKSSVFLKAAKVGDRVRVLIHYNFETGVVQKVGKSTMVVSILTRALSPASLVFGMKGAAPGKSFAWSKCAAMDEPVCVVNENWKGTRGGGYRIERELHAAERAPAKDIAVQTSGRGRVVENEFSTGIAVTAGLGSAPKKTMSAHAQAVSMAAKLRAAARAGRLDELRSWLDQGADPKMADINGVTALMWAASRGSKSCVEALIPVSEVNAKESQGYTALMSAAYLNGSECLEALLPWSDALLAARDGSTARSICEKLGKPNAIDEALAKMEKNALESEVGRSGQIHMQTSSQRI